MGKGTTVAKKNRGPSIHSRAARRATSPGIDTDKSLKNVRPPTDDSLNQRPAVLAAHHGGGIMKKKQKGRRAVPSARARRRHDKAMDRAEAVVERTAQKIARSRDQARNLNARRKPWDEVNQTLLAVDAAGGKRSKKAAGSGRGAEGDADAPLVNDFYADTDEEMDESEPEAQAEPQQGEPQSKDIGNTDSAGGVTAPVNQASVPLPPSPGEEEDEIL